MSYDIRFAVRVADTDLMAVIGEPEYSSPTYNNRPIFVKSMDWDYEQGEWYRVRDIFPRLERGIRELTRNPADYKELEPKNGWGGVASSLRVMRSIMDWLGGDRGWNSDIPLEHIYMCW